jgi:predicted Rossmann fold nucleotide-binding protein DprA/Smf involved in DNA uptake
LKVASQIQTLGNTELLELPKTAFLSSRRVAPAAVMRCYDWTSEMRKSGRCVIGGFQSALERDVLKLLLPAGGPPIVMVLARGMWKTVPKAYREAIDAGRLLVVSPFSKSIKRVSHETAEARNRWILENCDEVFWGSIDPDGTLARLVAKCCKRFGISTETLA